MLATLFATVSLSLALPSGLLSAVCYVESAHQTSAFNRHDGGSASIGVCQVKEATARLMGFQGLRKELADPYLNVYFAGLYLRYQLDRYQWDSRLSVSAYNAGTAKLDNKGKPRNHVYVSKVFTAWGQGR